MSIGKSAVLCYIPVPSELSPASPNLGVCLQFVEWFVNLDHSALLWVVQETHPFFLLALCFLIHPPCLLPVLGLWIGTAIPGAGLPHS